MAIHFGKHFHALREERGLSLREMARRIGVKHPQIVRWENQAHAPKQQSLERIARGLGCSVTDLLPPVNQKDTTGEFALKERIAELESKIKASNLERDRLKELFLDMVKAINGKSVDMNKLKLDLYGVALEYDYDSMFSMPNTLQKHEK